MADTDRELLELAAKAAGIVLGEHARFIGDHPQLWIYNDSRKHPMCRKPNRAGNVPWNPLADDGDSRRLEVMLNMHTATAFDGGSCDAWVYDEDGPLYFHSESPAKHGGDKCAAMRMAVLHVAAEIGRAMS